MKDSSIPQKDRSSAAHLRTRGLKRNIAALFVIKGLSIAIGLVLVPLTINYLNPTKYGIWITLSSVIGWFGFFDIGLGNGLRNKFAESLAKNQHELAREYVSTTYALLLIVVLIILVCFYTINPFLNWEVILNVNEDLSLQKELSILASIVFTFFCIRFVLKLIGTILTADQKPATAAFIELCGRVISLLLIILLVRHPTGSLLRLGIALSISPVLVFLISSLIFFSGSYRRYRPSIKYINFSQAKELFNLGIIFFIIQIAAVLLYQTNNIIISHLLGPTEVTPYNVAFKYFNILTMGFSIILTPIWSAMTEAWTKSDMIWIKSTIKKLLVFWTLMVLFGLIMLAASSKIYSIWIGKDIRISFAVSILVFTWVVINSWNGVFSKFLNGVGRIKLQLYIGLFAAFLNIPIAIMLGKKLGLPGILIANIIVLLPAAFLYPLQYRMLIRNTAKGLFTK